MEVHETGMYKYIFMQPHVIYPGKLQSWELPTLVKYKHIDMLSCGNN